MAGLYIHIPYCKQACHYCDFHFSTHQGARLDLIQAIAQELRLQKNYLDSRELGTVYFGGGTPSLLTPGELQIIMEAIHSVYDICGGAEITLEANPDDLTQDKLTVFRQFGINRLSLGVQSFDDEVLKFLNRAHNSHRAVQSVETARAVGFTNISIDLLYAVPGQPAQVWERNIEQALRLAPEHFSAYSLTLEPKTVFGRWHRAGKFLVPDEELVVEQFDVLMDLLGNAGYEHYEISNFCTPGKHSRHNSNYWKQEKYLGIGPSAHSFDGISRQYNVSNNARYVQSIHQGKVPFEREVLSLENKINEYIFTTLRTNWGCDLKKIKHDFQIDLWKENHAYLMSLVEKKLVVTEDNMLKLTRAGKLLADKIASDLFVLPAVDS